MNKTFSPKLAELNHDWYLVDAEGQTLGRLATMLATRVLGKHKPTFSAHMDCGDNVVVINAAKIVVTGNKLEDKKYTLVREDDILGVWRRPSPACFRRTACMTTAWPA